MAKHLDGFSGNSDFSVTRWTLVDLARNDDARISHEALSTLLRRYLPPLRSHLVLRSRLDAHRADDLLQQFVTDKVLVAGLFQKAIRDRGKFRSFLLVALDRFVSGQLRNERAAKRSPGKGSGHVPMDDALEVASPAEGADRGFDLDWARSVVEEAVKRMREACLVDGREAQWALFENRVVGPTLHGREPLSYAELAGQYKLESAEQASNMVLTGKRMFARNLREVVAEYTLDAGAIDEEIADLRRILSGQGNA